MSRTAIVTGAGSGIGAAVSNRLRADGWRVVGIDRAWPGPAEGSLEIDVRDRDSLRDAIAGIGELDALVNNAAVMEKVPLEQLRDEQLSAMLETNLTAAIVATGAAVPALERRGGAIVNVASVHALASRGGVASYAAAKGGLLAFTRAAAVELGPRGIRVNAIVPGAIDTPMLLGSLSGAERQAGIESLAGQTPLGRVGDASEIAEAVTFLADGDRSSFITGAALTADGGALAQLATE